MTTDDIFTLIISDILRMSALEASGAFCDDKLQHYGL